MVELNRDPIGLEIKELLNNLDIDAVLFDLDDTLIYTAEIFGIYMSIYSERISRITGIDEEVFFEELENINNEEYKTKGVNPNRWGFVVSRLANKHKEHKKEIIEESGILQNIYKVEPRLRPGAKTLVDSVRNAGKKTALVTHANVEWTYFKLDRLGLWNYFDSVVIVNEDGHKGVSDWEKAMNSVNTEFEKCLVLGDSLTSDIVPANSLGARTVWMPSPWSVYRSGQVPDNTVQINNLPDFFSCLARLR